MEEGRPTVLCRVNCVTGAPLSWGVCMGDPSSQYLPHFGRPSLRQPSCATCVASDTFCHVRLRVCLPIPFWGKSGTRYHETFIHRVPRLSEIPPPVFLLGSLCYPHSNIEDERGLQCSTENRHRAICLFANNKFPLFLATYSLNLPRFL